jgi:glyoxylase-like metal-dependent hydrolase (beta-lactamase superfamily II)
MRIINLVTIILFSIYLYPALSSEKFNLVPTKVSKNVYVFLGDNNDLNTTNGGAISNTGFIIGEDSILIIDAGPSYTYASKVIEIIKSYSNLPIKYLVVTHHHADHSFGISRFLEMNTKIIMSKLEIKRYLKYGNRTLRQLKALIGEEWFIDTHINSFSSEDKEYPLYLDLGNRNIIIDLYKYGHSDGDLVVVDKRSNTLFAGDLVFNERAPTIPHANIKNWNNYIDQLMDKSWDHLIPGHGSIIKNKNKILLTKNWINFINKTAKDAALNGVSSLEIFNQGLPEFIKDYNLAKETWYRDLPLLINKYEFD